MLSLGLIISTTEVSSFCVVYPMHHDSQKFSSLAGENATIPSLMGASNVVIYNLFSISFSNLEFFPHVCVLTITQLNN